MHQNHVAQFENNDGRPVVEQRLCLDAMLLQVVLIALVGMITFPYNWGWVESLMLGAILSATDPVAVIALIKVLIC